MLTKWCSLISMNYYWSVWVHIANYWYFCDSALLWGYPMGSETGTETWSSLTLICSFSPTSWPSEPCLLESMLKFISGEVSAQMEEGSTWNVNFYGIQISFKLLSHNLPWRPYKKDNIFPISIAMRKPSLGKFQQLVRGHVTGSGFQLRASPTYMYY